MLQHFVVAGEPKGKGRPRVTVRGTHAHAYTPEDTASYEALTRLEYARQVHQPPFEAGRPLSLTVDAYFGIPKSASKKAAAAMLAGDVRPTKKPDGDNLLKIIADALNGVAYKDDSQIVDACVAKYYAEWPHVEVWLSDTVEV